MPKPTQKPKRRKLRVSELRESIRAVESAILRHQAVSHELSSLQHRVRELAMGALWQHQDNTAIAMRDLVDHIAHRIEDRSQRTNQDHTALTKLQEQLDALTPIPF